MLGAEGEIDALARSCGIVDRRHQLDGRSSVRHRDRELGSLGERTVKGSYMGSSIVRQDVPKFIKLYKQGKLPVDKLRSGNIGLGDLNAGFDKLAAGDAIRQMLVMHDEFDR